MMGLAAGVARPLSSRTFYIVNTAVDAGTTVAAPIMLDQALRRQPQISPQERKSIIIGEILAEITHFVVSTSTFLGGAFLVHGLFKNHPNRELLTLINALIIRKVMGKLILRPVVFSSLTNWWNVHFPPPTPQRVPPASYRPRQQDAFLRATDL